MIRIGNKLINPAQIINAEKNESGDIDLYLASGYQYLLGDEAEAFWFYWQDSTADLLDGVRQRRERAEIVASERKRLAAKYGDDLEVNF